MEVLAVSYPLHVLKREAEKCRLLVPLLHVQGLVPEWYERHWIVGSVVRGLWRLVRKGYESGERTLHSANFPYKLHLDSLFDVQDKFTGSPFTSAQLQMLTTSHLNSSYRCFRDEHSNKKLSKSPWGDGRINTEVFFLHDPEQADSLRKKWSILNPPLTDMRDYLGEKMAFCLAWRVCWLKWGLSLPALTGLISVLYGVILLADTPDTFVPFTRTEPDLNPDIPDLDPDIPDTSVDATTALRYLLDNTLVPYHALFTCVWTVVHLVKWFSETTTLQFQWGTVGYTLHAERERSGYTGTPLDETFENRDLAPGAREKCWRLFRGVVSKSAILVSLSLVILSFFLSLFVKFQLRESLTRKEDYWIFDATFIANIASSTVNAICISILSKIFVRVAYKLTVFEDHIFETDFKRSLTWKLFILEFTNTHFKSLLILFFRDIFERDGIFGIPPEKCSLCTDDDCLTTIALNVIMILLIQDLVLPILLWAVSRIRHFDYLKVQELGVASHGKSLEAKPNVAHIVAQVEEELALPSETVPGAVEDEDYTALLFMLKKMKLYSIMVLYTAACPVAPAMLLCFEIVGHYVDRDKLTGRSRRVAAQGADNIKYWSSMQELVNTVGIITNAFIIAHVSTEGRNLFGVDWGNYYKVALSTQCDPCDEIALVKGIGLWVLCVSIVAILVVTSHLISLYFSFASVQLKKAMRREKYETSKKLNQSGLQSCDTRTNTGMSNFPLNSTKSTPCGASSTPRTTPASSSTPRTTNSTPRTTNSTPRSTPRTGRRGMVDNVVIRSPASEHSIGSNDSGGKAFSYSVQKATAL